MGGRAAYWVPCLLLACSAEAPAPARAGAGAGGGAGATGGVSTTGGVSETGGANAVGAAGSTSGGGAGASSVAGAGTVAGSAGQGGGADSARATYANVREIVHQVCGDSSCHGGEHALLLRDDDRLYSTLTSYVSAGCDGRVLVKPGAPEQSAFSLVLSGACGTIPRMPNGCVDGETCVPTEYVEGVRQWIASGAAP